MRHLAAVAVACGLMGGTAFAQGTTYATRLSVGTGVPGTAPAVGSVRLGGLGTTGGTQVLLVDSNFDVIRRVLAKTDLPAATAFEDESNTFSSTNTFSGVATFTANPVISSTLPWLTVYESDAGTDQKYMRLVSSGGVTVWQHMNDAFDAAVSSPIQSSAFGSLLLAPRTGQVLPPSPYTGSLGSQFSPWLSAYIAEANFNTLVAQETVATTGGRVLVGPTTTLLEAINATTTTIKVRHNNLASGDRVYLESEGRVEFMAVTSSATLINRAALGNLSVENGTTDWLTTGTATLQATAAERYRGAQSLAWTYSSGAANVIFSPGGGMLSPSTQYTVSIFVKRNDAAAVVPNGSDYQLYIDSFNGVTCTPNVQSMGNAWYRLYCSGTTGGSTPTGVGVASIPTSTVHFFDAIQVEEGASLTDWSPSAASYTVTRNLDGSGGNIWEAGTAVFNTGTTGDGWIDLYAARGMKASTEVGPTIVGNVRTGTTYNSWAPRWAIGNLRGLYGYASDTYGAAFGDPTAENVVVDATNGIRFRNSSTTLLQIDGNMIDLMGDGFLRSGSASAIDTGTGIFLAAGGGTPQFRIGNPSGNYLRWNGGDGTLRLQSAGLSIDEFGVRLAAAGTAGAAIASYGFSASSSSIGLSGYQSATQAGFALTATVENSTRDAVSSVGVVNSSTVPPTTSRLTFTAPYNNLANEVGTATLQLGNSNDNYGTFTLIRGHFIPGSDNTALLGLPTTRWAGAYFSSGVGIGIGTTAAYQLQLGADSAAKPSTATWTVTSTRKAKRNIRDYGSALDKIRQARIVEYEYTGDYGTPAGARGVGVVAEEIAQIFPQTVAPRAGDGALGFSAHELWMANVKATQELADRLDALTAVVEALRTRAGTREASALDEHKDGTAPITTTAGPCATTTPPAGCS